MRQKIIFCIFFLTSFFFYLIAEANLSRHLDDLKSKFPYGLLTSDYGLLTKYDLAINFCSATPTPFALDSISYQYWQCFKTKDISINCDYGNTPDEHEGILGLVVIKVTTPQKIHEYIERRLWPVKDCKGLVADAKKILKKTQHACISASFIDKEINVPEKETMSWIFDRIKTKNGCVGRDCDFTKEFKLQNCPKLKL